MRNGRFVELHMLFLTHRRRPGERFCIILGAGLAGSGVDGDGNVVAADGAGVFVDPVAGGMGVAVTVPMTAYITGGMAVTAAAAFMAMSVAVLPLS